MNVLSEKPTEKDLLDTCGTKDCYNVYREVMYKKCNKICVDANFAECPTAAITDCDLGECVLEECSASCDKATTLPSHANAVVGKSRSMELPQMGMPFAVMENSTECPSVTITDCDVGEWVSRSGCQFASQTDWSEGLHARSNHDQYHLGDDSCACDGNGAEVMTMHRGGDKDRVGEARCTAQLDIDYRIPPCCDCEPLPPPACDEASHCQYYAGFEI